MYIKKKLDQLDNCLCLAYIIIAIQIPTCHTLNYNVVSLVY